MAESMTQDELLALIDQAAEEGWTVLPRIEKQTEFETLLLGKQDLERTGSQG